MPENQTFETFFQEWLVGQERVLEELRSAHNSGDDHLRKLVSGVLAHYKRYYDEKTQMAKRNVFMVFSAPWFSPLEQTFLWIAGFKPGLAFQIVCRFVDDMSEDQVAKMEMLRAETAAEERRLTEKLAWIQEGEAAPEILESVIGKLRAEMEAVVETADVLRRRTAERVVEILTPMQSVKFLTAATEMHLQIRMRGFELWHWRRQANQL